MCMGIAKIVALNRPVKRPLFAIVFAIRESVDSLCRDGTDTPYINYCAS